MDDEQKRLWQRAVAATADRWRGGSACPVCFRIKGWHTDECELAPRWDVFSSYERSEYWDRTEERTVTITRRRPM